VKSVECVRKPCAYYFDKFSVHEPGLSRPLLKPFVPDPNDIGNEIASCVHRSCTKMGEIDGDRIYVYGKMFIEKVFQPLTTDEVVDFDTWLSNTPYSVKRRELFRKLRSSCSHIKSFDLICKSFIKNESYPKLKQARGINSYPDVVKALWGNIFHSIDKKTFLHGPDGPVAPGRGYFLKGVDPRDWANILKSDFENHPVATNDFSSFEAHHRGVYAKLVHHWMMHMLRNCGMSHSYLATISRAVLGRNDLTFKHIHATVDQRLMSGAMWTSSANGVLNLIIMSYLVTDAQFPGRAPCELVSLARQHFVGRVEGDDGICACPVKPSSGTMASLGLKLDFVRHEDASTADFCSIVCSTNDDTVLRDPVKFIRTFFAVPTKYKSRGSALGLLRAKAMSLYYNYRNSPVVGKCCYNVLRQTRSVSVDGVSAELDTWSAQTFERALQYFRVNKDELRDCPDMHSTHMAANRAVVEKVFKVSVQHQLDIEAAFDRWEDSPIVVTMSDHATLEDYSYDSHYSQTDPVGLLTNYPPLVQSIVDRGLSRSKLSQRSYAAALTARFEKIELEVVDYMV
jgi:hypothetical protein